MLDKFLPPTDNLYKFAAISGLMFIVLSFFPKYLEFKLGEMRVNYKKELQISISEGKRFVEESQKITNEYQDFTENQNQLNDKEKKVVDLSDALMNVPKNSKKGREIKKEFEEYFALRKNVEAMKPALEKTGTHHDALNEKLFEISKNDIELDRIKETIELNNEGIKDLKFYSNILFAGGMFLTILGFIVWYYRIQKPNDLILVNQAQNSEPPKSKRVKRIRPI